VRDVAQVLLHGGDAQPRCSVVARELGETIRVRRNEHIRASKDEMLGAACGRSIAVVVGAEATSPSLVDAAARAILHRRRTPTWRSQFAAIPRPIDWRDATVMLMACAEPELMARLPRVDGGVAIDRSVLASIHDAFAARGGFTLTNCVIFDLEENEADPDPTEHEDAIRAVG